MSLTRAVPAAVPSLFHSSQPCVPSSAEKNSVPLTFVRSLGSKRAAAGSMSLTRTVPAAVPSLFHSSHPCVPSLAAKNSVPLTFVRLLGGRAVAARVDVLDQGGAGGRAVALPQLAAVRPVVGREEQRAVHVRQAGRGTEPWHAAGLMSLTRAVPAAVPSLFHSSCPCVPSSAAKNSVAVDVREARWGQSCPAAGVDVLDQDGAGGGAVALPQLRAVQRRRRRRRRPSSR